jgi:hypothetical protein
MKIEGPLRSTGPIGRPVRAGAARPGSPFADHLAGTRSESPSAPVGLAASVQALVGLQEVDADATERRSPQRYGDDLLEGLEAIRLAMLEGRLRISDLRELAARLGRRRDATGDSRLESLIDEIELRVAVELAKRGLDA